MKATWNGATLAESDDTIVVEGNHYFPQDSIKTEFLQPSKIHTVCGWKGTASYYDVVVNGETNPDAAWYYPETKAEAKISRAESHSGKALRSQSNFPYVFLRDFASLREPDLLPRRHKVEKKKLRRWHIR